jgi:hypothetical protein
MGECIVHKVLIVIARFVACPVILAQQTLTNDSVVKLVKAGLAPPQWARQRLQRKLGSLLLPGPAPSSQATNLEYSCSQK